MRTKLNAEELASHRYNCDASSWDMTGIEAYAAAIREHSQPIADERDEVIGVLAELSNSELAKLSEYMWNRVHAILAKYPKP